MIRRRHLLLSLFACVWAPARARDQAQAPPLMLAQDYRAGVAVRDYWVSEKFDGVRGYWDGHALWTRGGQPVRAPAWFTAGWPAVPMDGELWAGRGNFARAAATVRQQMPNEAAWRAMRFMVFDLPAEKGPFSARLAALNGLLGRTDGGYAYAVPQHRVESDAALQAELRAIVAAGGEGLVLHRADAPYRAGRTGDLLKLKPFEDADARVVALVPGRGRHAGVMGALLVETPGGRRLRLGSGFSDYQRRYPPAVGSWVTYRFRGTTEAGLPRFATFLRERPDLY